MEHIQKILILMVLVGIIPFANATYYDANFDITELYNLTIANCQYNLADVDEGNVYVICNATFPTAYFHELRKLSLGKNGEIYQNESVYFSSYGGIKDFAVYGDYIYVLTYNNHSLTKYDLDMNQIWQIEYALNINQTLYTWSWDTCNTGHYTGVDSPKFPSDLAGSEYEPENIYVDSGGIIVSFRGIDFQCLYELRNYDLNGVVTMKTTRGYSGICSSGTIIGRIEWYNPDYVLISVTTYDGYVLYDRQAGFYTGGLKKCGCGSPNPACSQTTTGCFHSGDYPLITSFASTVNYSWSSVFCGSDISMSDDTVSTYWAGGNLNTLFTDTGSFLMDNYKYENEGGIDGSLQYDNGYVYSVNATHLSKYDSNRNQIWTMLKAGYSQGGQGNKWDEKTIATNEYVININSGKNLTVHNISTGEIVFQWLLDTAGAYYVYPFITTGNDSDIFVMVEQEVSYPYGISYVYWSGDVQLSTEENETENETGTVNLTIQLLDDTSFEPLEAASILFEDCGQSVSYELLQTNSSGHINTLVFNDIEYSIKITHPNYYDYQVCEQWTFNQTDVIFMNPLPESEQQILLNISTEYLGVITAGLVEATYIVDGLEYYRSFATIPNGWIQQWFPLNSYLLLQDQYGNYPVCEWNGTTLFPCQKTVKGNVNITLDMDTQFVNTCFGVIDSQNNILNDAITLYVRYECDAGYNNCNKSDYLFGFDVDVTSLLMRDESKINVSVTKDGYQQIDKYFIAEDKQGLCHIIRMELNMTPSASECYFRGSLKAADDRNKWSGDIGDLTFSISMMDNNWLYNHSGYYWNLPMTCTKQEINEDGCAWFTTMPRTYDLDNKSYFIEITNEYYIKHSVGLECASELDSKDYVMYLKEEYIDEYGNPDAGTTTITSDDIGSGSGYGDYESFFKANILPLVFNLLILILILGLLNGLSKTARGE